MLVIRVTAMKRIQDLPISTEDTVADMEHQLEGTAYIKHHE